MGRSDVMEQIKTREMMSAMADGRLEGEAWAQGMELAAADESAREAWHTYHLIGDVLRSSELAAGTPAQVFLSRLQVRLQQESIPAFQARALVPPQPSSEVLPQRATVPAANDSSFQWKLVAGFASVAAIGAIVWSAALTTGRQDAGQLAAASMPSVTADGTVLAGSERGVMIRDPRLDELMAAHRQLGGAALVAPAGYLRNAAFDGQGR
jgi:sigma-E factor negative regulatory protein RseA